MSKCISSHGEYSEHGTTRCPRPMSMSSSAPDVGVLDEEAMRAELSRLRSACQKLTSRLGGMVESINEQMTPEILAAEG